MVTLFSKFLEVSPENPLVNISYWAKKVHDEKTQQNKTGTCFGLESEVRSEMNLTWVEYKTVDLRLWGNMNIKYWAYMSRFYLSLVKTWKKY